MAPSRSLAASAFRRQAIFALFLVSADAQAAVDVATWNFSNYVRPSAAPVSPTEDVTGSGVMYSSGYTVASSGGCLTPASSSTNGCFLVTSFTTGTAPVCSAGSCGVGFCVNSSGYTDFTLSTNMGGSATWTGGIAEYRDGGATALSTWEGSTWTNIGTLTTTSGSNTWAPSSVGTVTAVTSPYRLITMAGSPITNATGFLCIRLRATGTSTGAVMRVDDTTIRAVPVGGAGAGAATPTATGTSRPSATTSATGTASRSSTATGTSAVSASATGSPSASRSSAATGTATAPPGEPTSSPTASGSALPTGTASGSPSASNSAASTASSDSTPTATGTATSTGTSAGTATASLPPGITPSPTRSADSTATASGSASASQSAQASGTASGTTTGSAAATATSSSSGSGAPTGSATASATTPALPVLTLAAWDFNNYAKNTQLIPAPSTDELGGSTMFRVNAAQAPGDCYSGTPTTNGCMGVVPTQSTDCPSGSCGVGWCFNADGYTALTFSVYTTHGGSSSPFDMLVVDRVSGADSAELAWATVPSGWTTVGSVYANATVGASAGVWAWETSPAPGPISRAPSTVAGSTAVYNSISTGSSPVSDMTRWSCFRMRISRRTGQSGGNWRIDDVSIQGSRIAGFSPSPTGSSTPSRTAAASATGTRSSLPTPTSTGSSLATASSTATRTTTASSSATGSASASGSSGATGTTTAPPGSPSSTMTATASESASSSGQATAAATSTMSGTSTASGTATATLPEGMSASPTRSADSTATASGSASASQSAQASGTASNTAAATTFGSPSASSTGTSSASAVPTVSAPPPVQDVVTYTMATYDRSNPAIFPAPSPDTLGGSLMRNFYAQAASRVNCLTPTTSSTTGCLQVESVGTSACGGTSANNCGIFFCFYADGYTRFSMTTTIEGSGSILGAEIDWKGGASSASDIWEGTGSATDSNWTTVGDLSRTGTHVWAWKAPMWSGVHSANPPTAAGSSNYRVVTTAANAVSSAAATGWMCFRVRPYGPSSGGRFVIDDTTIRAARLADFTPTPTASTTASSTSSSTARASTSSSTSSTSVPSALASGTSSATGSARASSTTTGSQTAPATATGSASATGSSLQSATTSSSVSAAASATATGAALATSSSSSSSTTQSSGTATGSSAATASSAAAILTPSSSSSPTAGGSSTATSMSTAMPTASGSATGTGSAQPSFSTVSTSTAVSTATGSSMASPSAASTVSALASGTSTGPALATATATSSAAALGVVASETATSTATSTSTSTSTSTASGTATGSSMASETASGSASASVTASSSSSSTASAPASSSATRSSSSSPAATGSLLTSLPSPSSARPQVAVSMSIQGVSPADVVTPSTRGALISAVARAANVSAANVAIQRIRDLQSGLVLWPLGTAEAEGSGRGRARRLQAAGSTGGVAVDMELLTDTPSQALTVGAAIGSDLAAFSSTVLQIVRLNDVAGTFSSATVSVGQPTYSFTASAVEGSQGPSTATLAGGIVGGLVLLLVMAGAVVFSRMRGRQAGHGPQGKMAVLSSSSHGPQAGALDLQDNGAFVMISPMGTERTGAGRKQMSSAAAAEGATRRASGMGMGVVSQGQGGLVPSGALPASAPPHQRSAQRKRRESSSSTGSHHSGSSLASPHMVPASSSQALPSTRFQFQPMTSQVPAQAQGAEGAFAGSNPMSAKVKQGRTGV